MTVKIDADVVKHVAGLAHLELSSDEVAYYETQLKRVLDHMAQLDAMPDTLEPGWRPDTVGLATPERPDVASPSLPAEEALAQAPQRGESAFLVPRIIE
jgi:aspartyl-tRNA(Asn)/glutamyl-tRNA(Gln) amidotransferase subunit C